MKEKIRKNHGTEAYGIWLKKSKIYKTKNAFTLDSTAI